MAGHQSPDYQSASGRPVISAIIAGSQPLGCTNPAGFFSRQPGRILGDPSGFFSKSCPENNSYEIPAEKNSCRDILVIPARKNGPARLSRNGLRPYRRIYIYMPKTAKFGVNPPKKQTEIFRTQKVNIAVS